MDENKIPLFSQFAEKNMLDHVYFNHKIWCICIRNEEKGTSSTKNGSGHGLANQIRKTASALVYGEVGGGWTWDDANGGQKKNRE